MGVRGRKTANKVQKEIRTSVKNIMDKYPGRYTLHGLAPRYSMSPATLKRIVKGI